MGTVGCLSRIAPAHGAAINCCSTKRIAFVSRSIRKDRSGLVGLIQQKSGHCRHFIIVAGHRFGAITALCANRRQPTLHTQVHHRHEEQPTRCKYASLKGSTQ